MVIQEIRRRLAVLGQKKVPTINKRMLRGGMQSRLARQEIKRYGGEISKQKARLQEKLNIQLSLLEAQKEEEDNDFSILSLPKEETLSPFNEPKLKRIRSRRGFF